MQENCDVDCDDNTKMAQMLCSLTNREECLACGSWTFSEVNPSFSIAIKINVTT